MTDRRGHDRLCTKPEKSHGLFELSVVHVRPTQIVLCRKDEDRRQKPTSNIIATLRRCAIAVAMRLAAGLCLTLYACGPVVLDDGSTPGLPTDPTLDSDAAGAGDTDRTADDVSSDTVTPSQANTTLCLANRSFEVTFAGGSPLEVAEWSDCTSDNYLNTPDIGSVLASPSDVARPAATDGSYYVGLSEDEQVSQRMCTAAQAGERRSFEIDLMSVPRGLLAVGSAQQRVFLEVWGGIAADCTQRQLLWASPALTRSWERYCVTITAIEFMDQLTLRARSDMTSEELGYVALDNLRPVERCTDP